MQVVHNKNSLNYTYIYLLIAGAQPEKSARNTTIMLSCWLLVRSQTRQQNLPQTFLRDYYKLRSCVNSNIADFKLKMPEMIAKIF